MTKFQASINKNEKFNKQVRLINDNLPTFLAEGVELDVLEVGHRQDVDLVRYLESYEQV